MKVPLGRMAGSGLLASVKDFESFIVDFGLKDIEIGNSQFIWSVWKGYVLVGKLTVILHEV